MLKPNRESHEATANGCNPCFGLSRTDLLTLLTLLAIILSFFAITNAVNRPKKISIQCVDNLKNIGLACAMWGALDNTEDFPFHRSTNEGGTKELRSVWPHFQTLSNFLSETRILTCRTATNIPSLDWQNLRDQNISYFVGLTAAQIYPQSLLSGDAGFLISGKVPAINLVPLTTNSDISYPKSVHRFLGNVAMGDGSVMRLSASRFKQELSKSELATNVLLLPR